MNDTSMVTDLQPDASFDQTVAWSPTLFPPLSPEPLTRRPPHDWHIFQPMEFQNGNV